MSERLYKNCVQNFLAVESDNTLSRCLHFVTSNQIYCIIKQEAHLLQWKALTGVVLVLIRVLV